jgi:MarR family transcriptional regulator, organic hydroperoxide resistance regulator
MKQLRKGGFLIAKIHQASGRVFTRKLKQHNLDSINPAQGRILFVLWEKDGISIQKLAQKTSLGKSTLTSMLDRLEEAGQVKRVPSGDDRRKIHIWLTEKDKKLRSAYNTVSTEMTALFYQGFGAREISAFEDYLGRVLVNLESAENKELTADSE